MDIFLNSEAKQILRPATAVFLVTCIEGPVLAVVLRGGPDVAEAQAGELLGGGEEVEEGHHQGAASYQERDQVVGGGVDGHQSQQT